MKIFGHPIHIILVHFPSALLPLDLICSFLSRYYLTSILVNTSAIIMIAGTLFGWLALITGLFDLLSVLKNKPAAMKKALYHGGLNALAVICYSILSAKAIQHLPEFEQDSNAVLLFKLLLVVFLIVANFLGGSLIIKDKVLDHTSH